MSRFLSPLIIPALLLFWSGCAHGPTAETGEGNLSVQKSPWTPFFQETMAASLAFEKKGEIARAVEEMKVALTIDPANRTAIDELSRLQALQKREALRHFEAGMAARGSNPVEARRELLAALMIRPEFPEAMAPLRELQLSSADAYLQKRLQREQRDGSSGKPKGMVEGVKEGEGNEGDSLERASSAFESGDYTTAIREFRKLSVQHPNDADIRNYLEHSYYYDGVGKFKRKEYKKALSSFSKVPSGLKNVDDYVKKCKEELKKAAR